MVPSGFRYAKHPDENLSATVRFGTARASARFLCSLKAEISRVSALLLSWSHLHGINYPDGTMPPFPPYVLSESLCA